MKRVLFKRYIRDIKKNFFRYAALLFLIVVCMFLVVAIVDSAYSLIEGTKVLQEEAKLEDCQVTLFNPFTEEEIKEALDFYREFYELLLPILITNYLGGVHP